MWMVCLTCLAWTTGTLRPAVAQAQDFVGTRALAMGEAYRALATGNDAIYFNPAGIAQLPRYSPELHYNFNLAEERHQFDTSMVDSKTSPLSAGIGYTFQGREFTRRQTLQHTATVALAYPFFSRMLSVGTGFKYVNISDAVVGNFLNALTADVGVHSRLPGGVSLAAVGYNLVPIQSTDIPISAAFGFAWDLGPASAAIFGGTPMPIPVPDAAGIMAPADPTRMDGPLSNLTLTGDWFINFNTTRGTKSRLSAGVEYLLMTAIPLRAGYLYDELNDLTDERAAAHLVSVGSGFIVPYFGLDVSFQQDLVHLDARTLAMSLKFFIEL
jgi:hypothetical protein